MSITSKNRALGFENPTPKSRSYLKNLNSTVLSSNMVLFFQRRMPNLSYTIQFMQRDIELHTLARWAWHHWQMHQETIGCIIPNLSSERAEITAIFQTTYQALFHKPLAIDYPISFPFETIRLKEHPIIQTAIDLLELTTPCNAVTISRLLCSPYIGGANSERFLRAQFDRFLRGEDYLSILPDHLLEHATTYHCFNFAYKLKQWRNAYKGISCQLPSEWVVIFLKQLNQWGWSTEIALTPDEERILQSWEYLLSEFASLDKLMGSITHAEALDKLLKLLTNTSNTLTTHSARS